MEPSYLNLWIGGELAHRREKAGRILSSCTLCPRRCRVNRLSGEKGVCGQGAKAKVAGALPHFGEEPPLSGIRGAGTVFFSGCALHCRYCQNYQISQEGLGEELDPEDLAQIFLTLQKKGCHNLDLVSPTPHLPFILRALEIALPEGFCLPLVYNTHGYLTLETLTLLDGIVDIYLPDMKYGDDQKAFLHSRVNDYTRYNLPAVKEMFRQVGRLKTDGQDRAVRGLLIRHLVLPENQSDSRMILPLIGAISPKIPISLMAQYRPCYKALETPGLSNPLSPEEYQDLLSLAEDLDFEEVFIQDLDSSRVYNPDFTLEEPFRQSAPRKRGLPEENVK